MLWIKIKMDLLANVSGLIDNLVIKVDSKVNVINNYF